MAGLVPAIYPDRLYTSGWCERDAAGVDGRVKPGHDDELAIDEPDMTTNRR